MSDIGTESQEAPESVDLDNITDEGLESLLELNVGRGSGEDIVAPEPTKTEEPEPEDTTEVAEPEAKTPEQEAAAEPESTEEKIPDERDLQLQELRAKLDFQQAHNSNLAGKIGHLTNEIKTIGDRAPQADPLDNGADLGGSEDRLSRLERVVENGFQQVTQGTLQQQIEQTVIAESKPLLDAQQGEMAEAVKEVAPQWANNFKLIVEQGDVGTARLMTRSAVEGIIAKATLLHRQRSDEKPFSQGGESLAQKKREAASAGAPGKQPAPKKEVSIDDLNDADLARLINRVGKPA